MQQDFFRIVILQKEASSIEKLEKIFGRKEFEVTSFRDQRKLIQHIRMQPAPNVFITDLELSEGDAFELLGRIRKDARWKAVPILVLAKDLSEEEIQALQQLKVNSYMTKPFKVATLFSDTLRLMGLEVVTKKRPVKRVKAGS